MKNVPGEIVNVLCLLFGLETTIFDQKKNE